MTRASDDTILMSALDKQQHEAIHEIACRILVAELQGEKLALTEEAWGGTASTIVEGAFVTLKRQGHLRACCGVFGHPMAISEAVSLATVRTATQDVRLPPLSLRELPFCRLDVSLLYNFHTLDEDGATRASVIEIGKHGLRVRHGRQAGLLLPVVAEEHGFRAKEFLGQTCRKAGLPTSAWLEADTEVTTFESLAVQGSFPEHLAVGLGDNSGLLVKPEELARLTDHCRRNVAAQFLGATPSYYAPGGTDGSLVAVALTLHMPSGDSPLKFVQLSFRPGIPLQATLLNLTATAAGVLRQRGFTEEDLPRVRVGVTLLTDVALQGDLDAPDLRGIEPARHALMVIEANRTVWVFDSSLTANDLLREIREQAKVTHAPSAQLLSLMTYTTEPRLVLTNAPPPQDGPTIRPAAVAGSFYPSDAEELQRLVLELIPKEPVVQSDWPAIMVPHAGLRYSGTIAARTFRRVKIPPTVIVLGPKHTPHGADWGVAPHVSWNIPGARIASDPDLAKRLTDAIPGLQLDSAAHQREHAIEVELPWIHHFAPQSRVLGIVIGSGNFARCSLFAEGLAAVVREMNPRPLLVISSDMNHFADDAENRRLDRMALNAMTELNPRLLYDTVHDQGISMCGLLPAVIVMETLRQLGGLMTSEEVSYGTSADVSGDRSRVVGYAGVLFR